VRQSKGRAAKARAAAQLTYGLLQERQQGPRRTSKGLSSIITMTMAPEHSYAVGYCNAKAKGEANVAYFRSNSLCPFSKPALYLYKL